MDGVDNNNSSRILSARRAQMTVKKKKNDIEIQINKTQVLNNKHPLLRVATQSVVEFVLPDWNGIAMKLRICVCFPQKGNQKKGEFKITNIFPLKFAFILGIATGFYCSLFRGPPPQVSYVCLSPLCCDH